MESPKQRADWKAAALSGGALSRKTRGTHRMAMMTGRQNGRAMRSNARITNAVVQFILSISWLSIVFMHLRCRSLQKIFSYHPERSGCLPGRRRVASSNYKAASPRPKMYAGRQDCVPPSGSDFRSDAPPRTTPQACAQHVSRGHGCRIHIGEDFPQQEAHAPISTSRPDSITLISIFVDECQRTFSPEADARRNDHGL